MISFKEFFELCLIEEQRIVNIDEFRNSYVIYHLQPVSREEGYNQADPYIQQPINENARLKSFDLILAKQKADNIRLIRENDNLRIIGTLTYKPENDAESVFEMTTCDRTTIPTMFHLCRFRAGRTRGNRLTVSDTCNAISTGILVGMRDKIISWYNDERDNKPVVIYPESSNRFNTELGIELSERGIEPVELKKIHNTELPENLTGFTIATYKTPERREFMRKLYLSYRELEEQDFSRERFKKRLNEMAANVLEAEVPEDKLPRRLRPFRGTIRQIYTRVAQIKSDIERLVDSNNLISNPFGEIENFEFNNNTPILVYDDNINTSSTKDSIFKFLRDEVKVNVGNVRFLFGVSRRENSTNCAYSLRDITDDDLKDGLKGYLQRRIEAAGESDTAIVDKNNDLENLIETIMNAEDLKSAFKHYVINNEYTTDNFRKDLLKAIKLYHSDMRIFNNKKEKYYYTPYSSNNYLKSKHMDERVAANSYNEWLEKNKNNGGEIDMSIDFTDPYAAISAAYKAKRKAEKEREAKEAENKPSKP